MTVVGVVLGRAAGVWEELSVALNLLGPPHEPALIAVNHAGRDYAGLVQHWVSYHPALFPMWIRQRQAIGHPDQPATLWSGIYQGKKAGHDKVTFDLRYVPSPGGSSGMLAVDVALTGLQLTKVILCGVPQEASARYDDTTPWQEGETYRQAWLDRQDELRKCVRSMSGWTRELLGCPTREWLD